MGSGLGRFGRHVSRLALVGALLCVASGALAQGVGRDSMPGGQRVASAEPSRLFVLSMTGAYGFTEDVLGDDASHHRVAGTLASAVSPTRWLLASARLDGRYDSHGGGTGDDGGTLDARVAMRARGALDEVVSLGAQLGVWIVGEAGSGSSPALGSIEGLGILSLRPGRGPVLVTAQAGFRIDRSGDTVSARSQLSPGDRLALGVSDANAVLMGIGAVLGRGVWSAFLEWTWDALIGGDAPSIASSPMHAVAGVTWIPSSTGPLALSAFVDLSPSSRPSLDVGAPLVPIDPLVSLGVQLALRFGARGRETAEPPRVRPVPRPVPVEHRPSVVRGRVLDDQQAPVAGAHITLTQAGAPGTSATTTSGDDGAFELTIDATGDATLVIESPGRPRVERPVRLSPDVPADVAVALEQALPLGQIRGLVRSLRGTALDARIVVEPGHLEARTDREGTFEVNVEPGEYEVTVTSEGYAAQRRRVRVEERGVVLLNLDMRVGRRERERRRP